MVVLTPHVELKKALFHGRHCLTTRDWSQSEVDVLLDVATDLKHKFKARAPHRCLAGQTISLLFFDASIRMRAAFEAGMTQLGGHAHTLAAPPCENPKDTAVVLSTYGHAIAIRRLASDSDAWLRDLATWAQVPVISLQSALDHPCRALATLMTLREVRDRNLRGLKVAVTWTASPVPTPLSMPQSLAMLLPRFGIDVALACPPEYALMPEAIQAATESAQTAGSSLRILHDMDEALRDADVVIAQPWGSGTSAYPNWTCDTRRLALAKPGALYLHPFPAGPAEDPHALVYRQTENQLHTAKAIMALTMADHEIEYVA